MSEKTRKDHIEAAAKAHTDLNLLHAIIALCEHSLFSTDCHGVERHIVKYCMAEGDKCLRRYDEAMALAQLNYGESPP